MGVGVEGEGRCQTSPPQTRTYRPVLVGFWANKIFSRSSPPTSLLSCSADLPPAFPLELSLGFLSLSLLLEYFATSGCLQRPKKARSPLEWAALWSHAAPGPGPGAPAFLASGEGVGGSSAFRVLGYLRATQGTCVVVVLKSDRCS